MLGSEAKVTCVLATRRITGKERVALGIDEWVVSSVVDINMIVNAGDDVVGGLKK